MAIARFVNNTNGLSIAPAEDSEYVEVDASDEEAVIDGAMMGDSDIHEDIKRIRSINVLDLLRIADAAVGVLDSESGALSLADLSLALRDAGFGDYTEAHADAIAALKDLG